MEQPTEFDLEIALQNFLDSLNPVGLLSHIDQDELRDHLHLEMDSLQNLGLTTEEAFVISKKRFGNTELIHAEYQKANPQKRIIQFLVVSMVFIFGLKMILNLMKITSFSILLWVENFSSLDVGFYVKWGDPGIQFFALLISGIVGVLLFKKVFSGKIKDFWPIPVCFLLSEVVLRFMYFLSLPNINVSVIGNSHYNYSIIIMGMTILGVTALLGMIFTNRNLKLNLS